MLARERGKVGNFVFVVTADDHSVNFDWSQACVLRGFNSFHHPIQNIDAGHLLEDVAFQTVKADRYSIEAGFFQAVSAMWQKVSIRGQRQIPQALLFELREFENDLLDIATHHWLAAGQTNLFNA